MYLYDILRIDKGDFMFIELFNIYFLCALHFRVNKRKEKNPAQDLFFTPRNVDSHSRV